MLHVLENPTLLAVWVAASSAIAIHSARTAKRMPAEQGGIAGWLRWYLVMATLAFVVDIVYLASGATPLVVAIFFVPACATSIALWIRKRAVRILALWCFYGYAVIGAVLAYTAIDATIGALTLSDSARQDARDAGALMGFGVTWGTYFLRSKRVKATYLRAERKRETHVADPLMGSYVEHITTANSVVGKEGLMKHDDGSTPDWAMRVKQWHWGKLLMLWIGVPILSPGVLIAVAGATDAGDFFNGDLLLGFFLFLLAVSIIVMLVITWIWLTGKERR